MELMVQGERIELGTLYDGGLIRPSICSTKIDFFWIYHDLYVIYDQITL